MEEILGKFIDEGKREHEEMETFIREFRTTNELLLKEQTNLLIDLRIKVHGLSKEMISQPSVEIQVPSIPFPHLLEEACTVTMNERCFAVLLNELPSKEKDPGSFTIPCHIGDLHNNNALANLGASINMLEDSRILIILGRPFLATARAMIDVFNKKLTLRVGDDEELLERDQSDSFLLKNLENRVNQLDLDNYSLEPDKIITEPVIRRIDSLDTAYLGEQQNDGPDKIKSEHLYSASANETYEKKPKLKSLPSHLEYAYLNGDESFPVIISSKLFKTEKKLLLQKNALWSTSQRCMQAIFHDMVEDFMEVFMDDFLVFGNSFDSCLVNLDKMLARSKETKLVLNWEKCHFMNIPFELLCDASDFAVGAVLGQRTDGKFKPIYYASETLNNAQEHYTTTEKELLMIKDKKGAENSAAYHLSRLENLNIEVLIEREITDEFPDEHLMMLKAKFNDGEPWYADYINYVVGKDEPYAFKLCADNVMRRCVAGSEILEILAPIGGHHSSSITGKKGLDFMGSFPDSRGNKYILVAVDYVSKWVEAQGLPTNDARVVVTFLRGLFASAARNRLMELNELAELRDGAYENNKIYKERTKRWNDSRLRGDKDFKTVYPYGAVEITDKNGFSFKINGQRLKKYFKGNIDKDDDEVVEIRDEAT
ncbi:reverse transcriptase domain-containing protein [Tanacetum coccineum]